MNEIRIISQFEYYLDMQIREIVDAYNALWQSFVGKIEYFSCSTPPDGRVEANGALLSRAEWPDLWEYVQNSGNLVTEVEWAAGKLGSYTAGNGSTIFRIPDLRGRGVIGTGQGSGLTLRNLGITSGEEKHTQTLEELVSHTHLQKYQIASNGASGTYDWYDVEGNTSTGASTGGTGGGRPFNVMDPYAAELVCIFAGRRTVS